MNADFIKVKSKTTVNILFQYQTILLLIQSVQELLKYHLSYLFIPFSQFFQPNLICRTRFAQKTLRNKCIFAIQKF